MNWTEIILTGAGAMIVYGVYDWVKRVIEWMDM